MWDRSELIGFIEELLLTHSPTAHEGEIDEVLLPKFSEYLDEVRQDPAGNIIGLLRGASSDAPLGIVTHKDELGMIVKRVLPDGRVKLESTSSSQPWIYGEGPLDLLGDRALVQGVLSFGARHVTGESAGVHAGKDGRQPSWPAVWVSTGMSVEELADQGVQIGTPAVIGRHRKQPVHIGDCIGGYGLDCKGSLGIMVAAMAAMQGRRPRRDVYFVATSREEEGVVGGTYAMRTLGLEQAVALEVGPVAKEYETKNCGSPILLYRDASMLYDAAGNRALLAAAEALDIELQRAVIGSFGSDASFPAKYGFLPRPNCMCFPTENTHGYELASIAGIHNTARVLTQFLQMECES